MTQEIKPPKPTPTLLNKMYRERKRRQQMLRWKQRLSKVGRGARRVAVVTGKGAVVAAVTAKELAKATHREIQRTEEAARGKNLITGKGKKVRYKKQKKKKGRLGYKVVVQKPKAGGYRVVKKGGQLVIVRKKAQPTYKIITRKVPIRKHKKSRKTTRTSRGGSGNPYSMMGF